MSEKKKVLPVYGYESPMQNEADEGKEESGWEFTVSFSRHSFDIDIDVRGLDKAEILGAIADQLLENEQDRAEFGMNLDALYDVVTDLKKGDEVELRFHHWFDSKLTADERAQFESLMYDATQELEAGALRVQFLHRDYMSKGWD